MVTWRRLLDFKLLDVSEVQLLDLAVFMLEVETFFEHLESLVLVEWKLFELLRSVHLAEFHLGREDIVEEAVLD